MRKLLYILVLILASCSSNNSNNNPKESVLIETAERFASINPDRFVEEDTLILTYLKNNYVIYPKGKLCINGKDTAQIKTDLASVSNSNAQLITIAEKLKERTNELESLKDSIKLLRADMAKTTNGFVNQKDLDNQLIKQKRLFQLEIKDTYDKIEKKIALLKFANQTDSSAKPNNN
jgi:hypothetical protein